MAQKKRRFGPASYRRNFGRGKAALKLQEFIDRHEITGYRAALDLKVSRPAVISWLSGRSIPGDENRKKIALWTGGAVPADLWSRPKTPPAKRAVQPYRSAQGVA